jgi:hypothetical protein
MCGDRLCNSKRLPFHSALQVAFAQLPADIVVHAFVLPQAFQVIFHDRLTFGFMVQGKRATLRRDWLGDDLTATGPSEGTHGVFNLSFAGRWGVESGLDECSSCLIKNKRDGRW